MSLLLAMCGVPVDTKKTPYVSEEVSSSAASSSYASASQEGSPKTRVCHRVAEELDLVFRSAMQSGIVDAEEGEMIRSVRNLDSKRIKAGTRIALCKAKCKKTSPSC